MPTGYTATLVEKGQDFRTFALTCARAFGACIEQRDDPMDELPKKKAASNYSAQQLENAIAERDKLVIMSSDARFNFSTERKAAEVERAAQYHQKRKEENARLDAMMETVIAWTAPTTEHAGLKSFMIEQITISKNDLSYSEKSLHDAVDKPHAKYYDEALDAANRSIEYHRKGSRKETERTNQHNDWIEKLYASLPA